MHPIYMEDIMIQIDKQKDKESAISNNNINKC